MRSLQLLLSVLLLLPVNMLAQDKPLQQSKNGWYLSPHGTIRILLLFVEVEYDVSLGKDPQPDGSTQWPKGKLPIWKDNVFDPQPLPVQKAMVTRYYQDISFGNYSVLGDYLDEVIHLKESEYPGVQNAHSIGSLAVKEANKRGTLRTHHGLSVTDFDLWKDGGKPGMPKETGADDPYSYDHVMVITRNSGLRHGTGSTDSGSPGKLFGYEADTQSRFGGNNDLPFEILKHEFNHLLIGGNNFHSGGGNAAQFESYQMALQGGWSMMGASGSSLLTCSGWDRDRMGWMPTGAKVRIRGRSLDGRELNTDLDPINGDTGVFVLRDFVTSGDALRIRLPFLAENEHQQWLWIENHQGYARNGSPTDRFHWEAFGADCIPPVDPGLFLMIQIDREDREGANVFGGYADYLHPLPANGAYDLALRGDTLHGICPFGGRSLPFLLNSTVANPLTGSVEQVMPIHDRTGDGKVERGEHFVPGTRISPGKAPKNSASFGLPDHAMRMSGTRRIDMSTNPSTSNIQTLLCNNTRETKGTDAPNVRLIHLNGISIELLDMRPNGDAYVRIRTDQTRMEMDQRWCADSIVLHPLHGRDGHSLTIARGARLLLDRSLTPTRMQQQDIDAKGGPWFCGPTRLTVLDGASIRLEDGARLDLENDSELHLLNGSRFEAGRKARIDLDSGTRIVLHSGAQMEVRKKVLRKLRKQGRYVEVQ